MLKDPLAAQKFQRAFFEPNFVRIIEVVMAIPATK
jgi:hypothetical protein